MSVSWSYRPPAVDARLVVHAAAEHAVGEAADAILAAAKAVVPVDTGALRDTGRISQDALEAIVSFGDEGEQTGIYAIVQHERLDFHHPNGGQAKFLEQPLHAEREHVAELLAEKLREALLG